LYTRIVADGIIQPEAYLGSLAKIERLLAADAQPMIDDEEVLRTFNKMQRMEYNAWKFYSVLSHGVKARIEALRVGALRAEDRCFCMDTFGVVTSFAPPEKPMTILDLFETNTVESQVLCYVDAEAPTESWCHGPWGPSDPLEFLMDARAMSRLAGLVAGHDRVIRNRIVPLLLTTEPESIRQTRAALANALSHEELSGSYALWMMVVWIAMGTPLQVSSTLIDVLRNAKVPMSLCNSGYHPTQLVSVTEALLYTIESSRIWCMDTIWRDRLCALLPAYEAIRDILRFDGQDVSKYDSRVEDLRLAWSLEREYERNPSELRKRLCSEFMDVYTYKSGDVALLDALKPDASVTLNTAKSVALLTNGFRVPYLDLGVPDVVQVLNIGSVYTQKENDVEYAQEDVVSICPITLRPHTNWKENAEAKRGPVQKQISAHKHALDFFLEHMRFPVEEDLDVFMGMLERTYAMRGCLPRGAMCISRQVFKDMALAMDKRRDRNPRLCDADVVAQHIRRGYDRSSRLVLEMEW